MKLVITGGHLSPALAVIKKLPKDTEVLMIGRKYGIEGDKAESLEYLTARSLSIPFESITTGRLQRKFTKHTILSLFKFPNGVIQSVGILKKYKPDVVLCFGGYVSLPVALAAKFLNIPVVIHEQTLEAGASNKIIAKFAKKICISWQSSEKFFPKNKVVLTGNPLREYQVSSIKYKVSEEDLPLIYITGGSSGSHPINVLIEGCITKLLQNYRVIHQTGDAKEFMDFERLDELKKSLESKCQKRYILTKFVDPYDTGAIYKEADLIISRSGINTVSELIFFGKPSILIPLPHSQNQEQLKNAMFFKSLGFGEVVSQDELSPDILFEKINFMLKDPDKYRKHAETAKTVIIKDAAEKIIRVIGELYKD